MINLKMELRDREWEQAMIGLQMNGDRVPQRFAHVIGGYLAEKVRKNLLSQKFASTWKPLSRLTLMAKKQNRDKILIETEKMANDISYTYDIKNKRLYIGVPNYKRRSAMLSMVHEYGAWIKKSGAGKLNKGGLGNLFSGLKKHAPKSGKKGNYIRIPPRPFIAPTIDEEINHGDLHQVIDKDLDYMMTKILKGKNIKESRGILEKLVGDLIA